MGNVLLEESGSIERPTTVLTTEEASIAIGILHRARLPLESLTPEERAVALRIQALPRHSRILIRRE